MAPGPVRRVSYVIPPSTHSVPTLQLPALGTPRHGKIGPILIPHQDTTSIEVPTDREHHDGPHIRHRLGVTSLALDTTTQLNGTHSPEGILYTGGKDGMIMSWGLDVPMKKRKVRYGAPFDRNTKKYGRWEVMTGWADDVDVIDEEEEDEEAVGDGDILGDVKPAGGRRGSLSVVKDGKLPFEEQWETDLDAFVPGKASKYRQSVQAHTDWINDILLCNHNQTVISGSSDGTVKAWNPHNSSMMFPITIGSHSDYVRCLSLCRDRNWVASGSFDRTVKLWDMAQPRLEPVTTLTAPESSGPKASVYALASDPFGHLVASGSPERLVRTWDPRSGKGVGKFVGHTDNIRAILVSEDSRYMLSASADASIKLWSLLSPQRCLNTFTHHTDSVWSLFSAHPALETFYSGDRSGLVCKVDVEGCSDVADGECILVCKDPGEGINRIAVMDDNLLWTATGSSSIKRWRAPARRGTRAGSWDALKSPYDHISPSPPPVPPPIFRVAAKPAIKERSPDSTTAANVVPPMTSPGHVSFQLHDELFSIPYDSLVRLNSVADNLPTSVFPRYRDAMRNMFTGTSLSQLFLPSPEEPEDIQSPDPISPTQARFIERDLAADAKPLYEKPDDTIQGDNGLVRGMIMNDRMHALTVNVLGEVVIWDIVRAQCLGRFLRDEVANASLGGSISGGSEGEKGRSPRQALETVRERIEGEAVVLPWAQVDTRIGLLTIQLLDRCFETEIFADEAGLGSEIVFSEDYRLNLGKWVLRNLFAGFIKEEQDSTPLSSLENGRSRTISQWSDNKKTAISGAGHPRAQSEIAVGLRTPAIIPGSPLINTNMHSHESTGGQIPSALESGLSPIPHSPMTTETDQSLTPRAPGLAKLQSTSSEPASIPSPATTQTQALVPPPPPVSSTDYFSLRRRQSVSAGQATPDDFSGWTGPSSSKATANNTSVVAEPQTPSVASGGGFMGRLKNLGKVGRRAATEVETPSALGTSALLTGAEADDAAAASPPKTLIQRLKSQPLTPPSSTEAPPLTLPPRTAISITEELAAGSMTLYRGTVGTTGTTADVSVLEDVMPAWLLEYLLAGKAPPVTVTKVSFILLPAPLRPEQDKNDQLPELLNSSQSKLSASRFLRVRKVTAHVQDKLDRLNSTSPRPSTDQASGTNNPIYHDISSPSGISTKAPLQTPGTPGPGGEGPNVSNTEAPTTTDTAHPAISDVRPEDLYEILCNDTILPLDMTLAAVRQYVWRQAGELVMYYRRKVPVAGGGGNMAPPITSDEREKVDATCRVNGH